MGKRIYTFLDIKKAADNRRALICPDMHNRPIPAAMIINMQGRTILRMISYGLYVYSPIKKLKEKCRKESEFMENETQIQEVVSEQVGMPTPLEVELDSQKAIGRISAIAKVIEGCAKVSIQRTNPKDWVRMMHKQKQADGSYKPVESFYLQATGTQKIRPIWGIYYRDRQVTKETNSDGTYAYIVTGKVGSKVLDQLYGEVVIEIDGGRSSSDSFFTKGERVPDSMDVRKAALANWEARAVTALIGLKNMSAEDLTRNGVDIKQVAGFEFQAGAEGGGKTELISIPQSKRLWAICQQNNVTESMLKKYLKEKFDLNTSKEIKRTDYKEICTWAERGGMEPSGREPGQEG